MAKKQKKAATTDAAKRAAQIKLALSRISATDTAALARASLTAAESRADVAKRLASFIGNRKSDAPAYAAHYNEGRRAVSIGYIAAYFRRKGDNRPDAELLDYAREVTNAAKPDAKSLKDGQRRCTEAEWQARSAAATFTSGLCSEFGIAVPASNGGNKTAGARGQAKPQEPEKIVARLSETAQAAVNKLVAKAKRDATKANAEALKFAPPAADSVPAFMAWVEQTTITLRQKADKVNAKTRGAIPLDYRAAIDTFADAIKAASQKAS